MSDDTFVIPAPPGRLGIKLVETGAGTAIAQVSTDSPLAGDVFPGDRIVFIDSIDVHQMDAASMLRTFDEYQNHEKILTISRARLEKMKNGMQTEQKTANEMAPSVETAIAQSRMEDIKSFIEPTPQTRFEIQTSKHSSIFPQPNTPSPPPASPLPEAFDHSRSASVPIKKSGDLEEGRHLQSHDPRRRRCWNNKNFVLCALAFIAVLLVGGAVAGIVVGLKNNDASGGDGSGGISGASSGVSSGLGGESSASSGTSSGTSSEPSSGTSSEKVGDAVAECTPKVHKASTSPFGLDATKIVSPSRTDWVKFGYRVAIHDDTAAVSAAAGKFAHIFARGADNIWSHQAELKTPNNEPLGSGGVGIYCGTAIIGTHFHNDSRGSAHIFVQTTDLKKWIHQAKLVAPDAALGDTFGASVGIYKDTVIIGSPKDARSGNSMGSAYIFVRNGSNWVYQSKLVAPDAAAWDEFGTTVGISKNTVVVGAPFDDDVTIPSDCVYNCGSSGSAYVFTRSGSEWTYQSKLLAPDGDHKDNFGISAAIDEGTIVVGAYWDDYGPNGSNKGSAHVFVRNGRSWNHEAQLKDPRGYSYYEFGCSVGISGDTVIVGQRHADHGGRNRMGAAHVFIRNNSTWSHQAKLIARDAGPNAGYENFGEAVAIDGNTAIVGKSQDPHNAGSAYIWQRLT